jgi:meiotic recombination protein SPO11
MYITLVGTVLSKSIRFTAVALRFFPPWILLFDSPFALIIMSSTAGQGRKKRVVERAKDADLVLRKCRKLREQMLVDLDNQSTAVPDSVASTTIVEVAELSGPQVLEGMEAVALSIAQQVLAKKGFSMDIPSRAASNQIYVKEWDRIVLGGKKSTRSFLNVKESRKSAITLRVLQLLHAGG